MNYDFLYTVLLYTQWLLAPVVLISLLFITAPYGRHHRPGWGISLPDKLAWLLMELPAVLVPLGIYIWLQPEGGWWLVLLLVWQWHYVYRTFVFPFLIKQPRKHFPLMLAVFALLFNCINGFINSYGLFALQSGWGGWTVWGVLGFGMFMAGWLIHVHSDHILRRLRAADGPRYGIPQGGLFRWVSSPHYLGEVIQWTGWAVLTGAVAGWAFAVFTLANLLPRALANQRWYLAKFPQYPKERRAMLPYVI